MTIGGGAFIVGVSLLLTKGWRNVVSTDSSSSGGAFLPIDTNALMVTTSLLLRVAGSGLLSMWFMPPSIGRFPYVPFLSFPLSPLSTFCIGFLFHVSSLFILCSFTFLHLYLLPVSSHLIYSFLFLFLRFLCPCFFSPIPSYHQFS